MKSVPIYVGLDYHQRSVQVCVVGADGEVLMNSSCDNAWQAIARRVSIFGAAVQAGIEACGGAADLAEELTRHAGWSIELAHPGYVHRMKQNPDKTDHGDARLLADLVRVGYLPRVWLAPEETRELRRLVRYRQQLVNERRNIKLRISALLRDQRLFFALRSWTKPWRAWIQHCEDLPEQSRWIVDRHLDRFDGLTQDIKDVAERLGEVTQDDPVVKKLLGLPGVGPVTAWVLRAEIGRFDRFRSGKQLSHFCGLSPRNASSGTRQADAGLIKAANRELRAVLIQAAHRLVRYDARWSMLGQKLRSAGKSGSVVAAAVGNRWIRWLYHQMQPAALAA